MKAVVLQGYLGDSASAFRVAAGKVDGRPIALDRAGDTRFSLRIAFVTGIDPVTVVGDHGVVARYMRA